MDGNPLVLVVEDEPLVREMIVLTLRDAGWEILEASTGEGALTQLANHGHRMKALFTDIELGGLLSGWDVADACRAAYPRMRIVYASGRGVDPSRVLSDSRYFRKPYSYTAVIHACALQ
jgi:CheY-like chemotaxis protein